MSNCCARVGIIFWEVCVCVCVFSSACVHVCVSPHMAVYSPGGRGLSVGISVELS